MVQESKEKARLALLKAGNRSAVIESLIPQAEERSRQAQQALAGAELDARVARDSAQQAQQHAEQASQDAVLIRVGASETRDKAGQLKDTAETLTVRVAETANRLSQLEQEVSEDQGLAKEVNST